MSNSPSTRSSPGLAALALALGSVLAPRAAQAMPPNNPDATRVIGGLRYDVPNPLVTTLREVEIDCREGGAEGLCRARLVYQVQNPSAETVSVNAQTVSDPEARATTAPDANDVPRTLNSFALSVPPGAAIDVPVLAPLRANPVGPLLAMSIAMPVAYARHPVLYRRRAPESHAMNVRVEVGDARIPDGGVPVRLRAGSAWHFSRSSRDARVWNPGGEAGVYVTTLASANENVVRFDLDRTQRIGHGGPIFGIGGALVDASGIRARVGYEIAGPFEASVISVALDTDFSRNVSVAPVFEVGTPMIVFIPSIALGAGPVLRVAPAVAAGARLQGTIQFPFVGFVTSADLYPAQGELPAAAEVTMMARFSL